MNYIHFSKGIDDPSVNALIGVLVPIANSQDRDVTLLLNSNGGNVVAGVHCYNFILGLNLNLTTHNVSNVDSIANVIFLAGATRLACPAATFMFHSVGFDTAGPIRVEESNLRQWLNSVVADNRRIGGIISGRTNLSAGRASGLFRTQQTKDANWALRHNFIHQIENPAIPTGTNIIQIT